MKKRIELNNTVAFSENEIKQYPLWDGFYKKLIEKVGYDYDKVEEIDCRDVSITPEIEESWFKTYDGDNADLSMMCLCYGPKADLNLSGYVALVKGTILVSV